MQLRFGILLTLSAYINFTYLLTYLTNTKLVHNLQVAERVAEERGETLGQSVGYQIRLEQ